MTRTKYAFEFLANMFVFAFGIWLLIMSAESINKGGVLWGEPNHLILGLEVCLASVMLGIGIERFIDDIRHIHSFTHTGAVLEISVDSFLILGSSLMLGTFIAFFFTNVFWDVQYAKFNMVIAGLIMCVATERLIEDALKD